MTLDDYKFPCMVKADHGKATMGTFKVENEEQMQEVLAEMDGNIKGGIPVITEIVENIEGNYCVQFYQFKSGEIHWLGVTNQLIDESLTWGGGVVDWDQQAWLKSHLFETIKPLIDYLHQRGYFGVVGVDVLTNKEGQFIIDVNARFNGTTPQLCLAPAMAAKGYKISVYESTIQFKCTSQKFVENA